MGMMMNIGMMDPFAMSGADLINMLGAMARAGAWGGGFFLFIVLALVLWFSYSELKHYQRF
jgi:hypothetical protein